MIGLVITAAMLISSIPLFLIFADYKKSSNIHKAVFFVLSFLVLSLVFALWLLPAYSFYLSLLCPFVIFGYVLLARSQRP